MTGEDYVLGTPDRFQMNESQIAMLKFIVENWQPGDDMELQFRRLSGPNWVIVRPDMHANPETCLHNVVQQMGTGRHTYHVVCVSCQTTVSYEWVLEVGKNYQYDSEHNVWVHTPKKKS